MHFFTKILPRVVYHQGDLTIKWPSLGDVLVSVTMIMAIVGIIVLIIWWVIHHFGHD